MKWPCLTALLAVLVSLPSAAGDLLFDLSQPDVESVLAHGLPGPETLEWKQGRLHKVAWRFEPAPEPELVFAVLDAVGNGSEMAIQLDGRMSADMRKVLSGCEQAWLVRPPEGTGTDVLVRLRRTTKGILLDAQPAPPLGTSPAGPLELVWKAGDAGPFMDWSRTGACPGFHQCELVSAEVSGLSATVSGNSIVWRYREDEADALHPPDGFAALSPAERKMLIQDFIVYFHHEYELMAKIVSSGSPGIFSWQHWEWLDAWKRGAIGSDEVDALLRSKGLSRQIRVWSQGLGNGQMVQIFSDGSGGISMELK